MSIESSSLWAHPDDDLNECRTNHFTDAEYGISSNDNGTNNAAQSSSSSSSSSALISNRIGCILFLSLAMIFVLIPFELDESTSLKMSSIVGGAMQSARSGDGIKQNNGYEPLVGVTGEEYEYLDKRYSNAKNNTAYHFNAKTNTNTNISTKKEKAKSIKHPRIACITTFNNNDQSSCGSLNTRPISEYDMNDWLPSIPTKEKSGRGGGSSSEDVVNLHDDETAECKLSDPSYQELPSAPSTCNDVHALPFRFGPTPWEPISSKHTPYPSRHSIKYLTSGGFRSVWTVNQFSDPDYPKVIMKTNRLQRGWSGYYLDQNRRDILISERAGGSPVHSNVLPVFQYCAFSSVVPFATAGVLDDYMYDRRHDRDLLSAEEQYSLAMQAARGLYEMHLYKGGKATIAHADVKPSQFLLFDPPRSANATTTTTMPILQINDFNRGKFLTRDKHDETCPFRMCHVHHKGSLYRSPEEYMKCADQTDGIDVYSLGGVFYYLLADGYKPWYYIGTYDKGVKEILAGEQPRLPRWEEYKSYGEKVVAHVKQRSKHPLFLALAEVMSKCWAFESKDRPSSMQVVQMLEERWRKIHPSSNKGSGKKLL